MNPSQQPNIVELAAFYGHAQSAPASQTSTPKSWKKKLVSGVLVLALLVTSAISLHQAKQMQNTLNTRVASLVDEMGKISQDQFNLNEKLTSQEAVIKDLNDNFSKLGGLLAKNGRSSDFEMIFGSLSMAKAPATPSFLMKDAVQLASEDDGMLDVLLLGTNGRLTDTIMVATVNKEAKKVSLFSVPRDLYVNGRRINETYNSYGIEQLIKQVETITGRHIDKYVKIDLAGFTTGVDLLGGVDVYVDKDIYDSTYPNGKGGYDPYSIKKGLHHMDGAEALKYARSRHASSDFDRAGRQQKILTAVRSKLESLHGNMKMEQMAGLFQTGLSSTETNVTLLDAVGYFYDYKSFDLRSGLVLSSSNYLISRINEAGAYTLLPKTGDYAEIQAAIAELVE